MILLGYIFTVINYLFYCLSRFLPHKKDMLFMNLVANLFMVSGLYCLGSISGAFAFIINFMALIAANIKEHLNKKWPLFFILFQILYLLIIIFTYQGISSVLIFITSSISLFGNWWLKPQALRFLCGCNSIIFLVYQISIKNWAGLLEIFVTFSSFGAYLKYRRTKKKPHTTKRRKH
ncbi:MAG: YgjV family protein [Alphaproteobacteria bacterium]|nr:YgjV family protein [Alphaproteobacteria bacterium]